MLMFRSAKCIVNWRASHWWYWRRWTSTARLRLTASQSDRRRRSTVAVL